MSDFFSQNGVHPRVLQEILDADFMNIVDHEGHACIQVLNSYGHIRHGCEDTAADNAPRMNASQRASPISDHPESLTHPHTDERGDSETEEPPKKKRCVYSVMLEFERVIRNLDPGVVRENGDEAREDGDEAGEILTGDDVEAREDGDETWEDVEAREDGDDGDLTEGSDGNKFPDQNF